MGVANQPTGIRALFPRAPPKFTAFMLFFLKDCIHGASAQSWFILESREFGIFSPVTRGPVFHMLFTAYYYYWLAVSTSSPFSPSPGKNQSFSYHLQCFSTPWSQQLAHVVPPRPMLWTTQPTTQPSIPEGSPPH